MVARAGPEADGTRRVETLGVKRADAGTEKELMLGAAATDYRSLFALVNCISQDRVDVGYAAKELSERMLAPEVGDDTEVKRVARYLRLYPECAYMYA